MSESDRNKWDPRYAAGSYAGRPHPSEFLVRWLPSLQSQGHRALDYACGRGRNAIYLAEQGYAVDAIDISSVALGMGAKRAGDLGLAVNWICADLDTYALPEAAYDLAVVARYLQRDRFSSLKRSVRVGGTLIYETHVVSDAVVGGPSNPAFRLKPNELLRRFADFHVHFYEEGVFPDPDGDAMALARIVATRSPT